MKQIWQIIVLVGLAFACAVIVFVVNAPKWLDGQVPPATQGTR